MQSFKRIQQKIKIGENKQVFVLFWWKSLNWEHFWQQQHFLQSIIVAKNALHIIQKTQGFLFSPI